MKLNQIDLTRLFLIAEVSTDGTIDRLTRLGLLSNKLKPTNLALNIMCEAQANAMELTSKPQNAAPAAESVCCPYCKGEKVTFITTWQARSEDPCDLDNTAQISEYQCFDCDNRSFWA